MFYGDLTAEQLYSRVFLRHLPLAIKARIRFSSLIAADGSRPAAVDGRERYP